MKKKKKGFSDFKKKYIFVCELPDVTCQTGRHWVRCLACLYMN